LISFHNFAKPYQGKSVKLYLVFTIKIFACFVFPGLELVFTKSFLLNKAFIRLDLPTLDLQIKIISFLLSKNTLSALIATDL